MYQFDQYKTAVYIDQSIQNVTNPEFIRAQQLEQGAERCCQNILTAAAKELIPAAFCITVPSVFRFSFTPTNVLSNTNYQVL